MTTMERLLEKTKEEWNGYYQHPFVLGLQEGTLDKEKFKYYMIQDYLYLVEYAKVYAIGLAKAKNLEQTKLFFERVTDLTQAELSIHKGYLPQLGETQESLESASRALMNLSYTSYMLRVAYEEGVPEILAAVLPCAYSYELIAKNMVKNRPESLNEGFYKDWIQGYASDSYAKGNQDMIEALNTYTKDYTEEQLQHLEEIFIASSRYETSFWDFSWKLEN